MFVCVVCVYTRELMRVCILCLGVGLSGRVSTSVKLLPEDALHSGGQLMKLGEVLADA